MRVRGIGRYQRGHGPRWFIIFEGETESEAIAKVYAFVGETHSSLERFDDFDELVKWAAAA